MQIQGMRVTKAEYLRYYKRARAAYPKLTKTAMRKIHRAYVDAAEGVSRYVAQSTMAGLSTPTSRAYKGFQKQLEQGARQIYDQLYSTVQTTVSTSLSQTSDIHTQYMADTIAASGAKLSKAVIKDMYIGLNDGVVKDLVSRVSQRGYTFSERIWRTANDFPDQLNRVLSSGIAQNRDVIKIAKDMNVFVADGKIKLVKRYGKLKRGTRAFSARISNSIDYRAYALLGQSFT